LVNTTKLIQIDQLSQFPAISKTNFKTYVDESAVVSIFQVPEDGGIVEIGEAGHVLAFLELWRVHLRHLLLLEHLLLKKTF
jgi:hypothetical protein